MKHIFLLLLISNIVLAKDATLDLKEQCLKNSCRTDQIPVETAEGMENYTHIILEKNCRIEIDDYNCDYEYYLIDPKGHTVKIDNYLVHSLENSVRGTVIKRIVEERFIENIYDCRAITKSSWKDIYEKKIKRENNSICVSYEMNYPFAGKVKDCGLLVSNTIGYAPNVITMENAATKACNLMRKSEDDRCEVKAFGIYTNKKSTYYEILIAKDITPIPNPYPCIKNSTGCSQKTDIEYPIYEIDVISGEISLKKS